MIFYLTSMVGLKNSDSVIAGIDLSLTSTGFVIIDPKGAILFQEVIYTKKLFGYTRMAFIRNRVIELIRQFKVTDIAIEGFVLGFGRKTTNCAYDLAGLGHIVRLNLFENSHQFNDISPTSLKGFIIKGNADKQLMMDTIKLKYGIEFTNDNLADAYALARMLLCFGSELPQYTEKGGIDKIRFLREQGQEVI